MNEVQLRIRRGRRGDAEPLSRLLRDTLVEYGLPPDPTGTDADVLDVERNYHAHGGEFEVLVDPDGEILGCYGLFPLARGELELRKMYLRPQVRGQGWGRAMLHRAIKRAIALDYEVLRLETASVLREAVGLYEAFGFVVDEEAPDVDRCDAVYRLRLPEWRYSGPEPRQLPGD